MAIFTDHAKQRCQDRNIPQYQVNRVLDYGENRPARGSRLEYYINIMRAHELVGAGVNVFDCVGISVVIASDDVVMTVYRNDEKSMQWRLRGERRAKQSRLKVSLGQLIGESLTKPE